MELRNREISMAVRQSLIRLGYRQRLEAVDSELIEKACDVDRALELLDAKREQSGKQKPVRFDDVVDKLVSCRTKDEPICFFSPWGPRYKIKTTEVTESSAETATLREVRDVFGGLADLGFRIRFLVMPADTYGTEINGLSQDFVNTYFKFLLLEDISPELFFTVVVVTAFGVLPLVAVEIVLFVVPCELSLTLVWALFVPAVFVDACVSVDWCPHAITPLSALFITLTYAMWFDCTGTGVSGIITIPAANPIPATAFIILLALALCAIKYTFLCDWVIYIRLVL